MRLYAGKRVKAPVVGNCYVGTSFYIPKAVMTTIGVIIALPGLLLFKWICDACEYMSNAENASSILATLAILAIIGLMVYAVYSAWKPAYPKNPKIVTIDDDNEGYTGAKVKYNYHNPSSCGTIINTNSNNEPFIR